MLSMEWNWPSDIAVRDWDLVHDYQRCDEIRRLCLSTDKSADRSVDWAIAAERVEDSPSDLVSSGSAVTLGWRWAKCRGGHSRVQALC